MTKMNSAVSQRKEDDYLDTALSHLMQNTHFILSANEDWILNRVRLGSCSKLQFEESN